MTADRVTFLRCVQMDATACVHMCKHATGSLPSRTTDAIKIRWSITFPQQEGGAVATANGEVVEVESGSDAEAAGAGAVTTPAPIPSSPSFSGEPSESSASSDPESSPNLFFTGDINSEPCRRDFVFPAPSFRTQMPPPLPKAPALAISSSQKNSEHGENNQDQSKSKPSFFLPPLPAIHRQPVERTWVAPAPKATTADAEDLNPFGARKPKKTRQVALHPEIINHLRDHSESLCAIGYSKPGNNPVDSRTGASCWRPAPIWGQSGEASTGPAVPFTRRPNGDGRP